MRPLLVALSLVVGWLSPQQSEQAQPFTSGADLVVVSAVVVDGRGRTITGLTADDFEVREDGQPVAITTFVPADDTAASGREEGRFIVLLLDDLRTPMSRTWRVKEIAKRFVTLMGPRDVVTVIKLNGHATSTSNNPQDALKAINSFAPVGAPINPIRFDALHALETIGALSQQMAESPHRRKVLVCIGAAALFNPQQFDPLVAPEHLAQWSEAIRATARHNVSVYVVDPAGMTTNTDVGVQASSLERTEHSTMRAAASLISNDGAASFASETGGDAFFRTNNFDGAVKRIWHESGSYYLLGYAAPINDDRLHKIEVRVKRPGAEVRARRARG